MEKFKLTSIFGVKQDVIQIALIKIFILTLFLPFRINNIALLLLVVFWIVTGQFRGSLSTLWKKKALVLFIGFYLLHLVGLFYSDDLYTAYKELERKVPLLLLPLIIGTIERQTLEGTRRNLLSFYTKCAASACFLLLLYASYRYSLDGDRQVFYFKEFTDLIHVNPIYLAMYVLFAFGIYFYDLNTSYKKQDLVMKGAIYLGTVVVLMCISSKTALAVFALMSFHIVFLNLRGLSRLFRISLAIAAALILVASINYFPVTKERIQNLAGSDWVAVWQGDYTKKAETYTGFTLRISFWRITLRQLGADGLLAQGVGTGDGLAYLDKAYQEPGLISAGYTDFNLHNAFMEVILEFGLIGLIIYLIIWIKIAALAFKAEDKVLLVLLVIFLFFSMTESILYVNKGLAFFSLWVSLLVNFIYLKPTAGH